MNRKNRVIAKGNLFTKSVLPLFKLNEYIINNNTLPINKDLFIKPRSSTDNHFTTPVAELRKRNSTKRSLFLQSVLPLAQINDTYIKPRSSIKDVSFLNDSIDDDIITQPQEFQNDEELEYNELPDIDGSLYDVDEDGELK